MIDPRHTLHSFGVPLDGPSWMYFNNKSVVTSSTIPHLMLGKGWKMLCHHCMCEAVAVGWLRFERIPGMEN